MTHKNNYSLDPIKNVFLNEDDPQFQDMTYSQFLHFIGLKSVFTIKHTYEIVNQKRWLLAKLRYGL